MKAKLVMLVACLCLVFSAFDSKAQCLPLNVENSTGCSYGLEVEWDCNGTIVPQFGTVGPNTSMVFNNPGTAPNCCTFYKVRVIWADGSGQTTNLGPQDGPGTVNDCNSGTANIVTTLTSAGDVLRIY